MIMPTVTHQCGGCKNFFEFEIVRGEEIICPHCQKNIAKMGDPPSVLEICPVCGCRQFWVQKDFNQLLGGAIMLVGIILVPQTYGLSLPVFALVDWLMYRRVTTMAVCYKCASEFRGFKISEHVKPFMHHIGLKYDKYR